MLYVVAGFVEKDKDDIITIHYSSLLITGALRGGGLRREGQGCTPSVRARPRGRQQLPAHRSPPTTQSRQRGLFNQFDYELLFSW